jgi:hypothetical protein
MERGVFDILIASPEGRALIWPSIEKERAAWAREREGMARGLEREIEAREREREFLIDRESKAIAELQRELDFSNGLVTVRAVLEGIVTSAFPSKSATDALRLYCEQTRLQNYLGEVSTASGISMASLTKSAKGVYGMLSQTIHGGSTHHSSDDTAVPQAVLRDKSTLYAVAAIFRLERRDVRFYAGAPSIVLKLPSPPRSASHSAAASAANSPPKAAEAGAGDAGADSPGEGAAAVAEAAKAAEAAAAVAVAGGSSASGGGNIGGSGEGGGVGGGGGGGGADV